MLFLGFLIGVTLALLYHTYTCDHLWWIDGDEQLFCLKCGVLKEKDGDRGKSEGIKKNHR